MLCHYCGFAVENDDVNFEQRLGITTDDPEGLLAEERFVVGSASCTKCGAQTQSVVNTYLNLGEELDDEYQTERRAVGHGESL